MMKTIQGAEATVSIEDFRVVKTRVPKAYRLPELDGRIRKLRTRREAKTLQRLRGIIRVPQVFSATDDTLELEKIEGVCLKDALNLSSCEKAGQAVGTMHAHGVVHGDLTTSNVLVENDSVALVDFGLSFSSHKAEDFAADVHVLEELVPFDCFEAFWRGYEKTNPNAKMVFASLEKLRKRGRYRKG
ncbi:MAG TPA: KEOPS complex kinase/ATPase Bud32 [Candidatus Norongarragalinales archaeon]|nr:KEOPS complex kinase/ATPase Bud32 [Candidatus Norongarragalinales archaeon]